MFYTPQDRGVIPRLSQFESDLRDELGQDRIIVANFPDARTVRGWGWTRTPRAGRTAAGVRPQWRAQRGQESTEWSAGNRNEGSCAARILHRCQARDKRDHSTPQNRIVADLIRPPLRHQIIWQMFGNRFYDCLELHCVAQTGRRSVKRT